MVPSSPPVASLSRSRLKALATWVRDELDLLVAREGPNVLRPNDVLILHETFIALRHASDITVLDLRATGIHRAVQDIAGVATRWPSRLCDDCDEITSFWTAKFGPLNELYPFLYGRGGRLEGIASADEYSREALLKRWSDNCPDKLHPKRSHRLGDLGFRAGDWWINTLFAHHAGIIGLEAVEGGTTFDKNGAYALVLKDTGEVEACLGDAFTYRVAQWDKGKYRLTAATPRSRDPIRVLRSHSINSVWGPKAGVRYEGLVTGWSIRQAKSADTTGGQWKLGDILFEVRFQRDDPVPMEFVTIRPTATEVDDYAEYKRIQKLRREGKRKGPGLTGGLSNVNLQMPRKAAPPIPPLQSTSTFAPPETDRATSPSTAGKALFRHLHFGPTEEHATEHKQVVLPPAFPDPAHLRVAPRKGSTLVVPGYTSRRAIMPNSSIEQPPPISRRDQSPVPSNASNASAQSYIGEVAPWVDFDADLPIPENASPPVESDSTVAWADFDADPTIPENEMAPTTAGSPSQSIGTDTSASTKGKIGFLHKRRIHKASLPIVWQRERRKSGDFKGLGGLLSPGPRGGKAKDPKGVILHSKMGKVVDGAVEEDTQEGEGVYDERTNNVDSDSFISITSHINNTNVLPDNDPFISGPSTPVRFPSSFEKSICQSRPPATALAPADEDSLVEERLLRAEYGGIVFTDPFCGSPDAGKTYGIKKRRDSAGVAPDHIK